MDLTLTCRAPLETSSPKDSLRTQAQFEQLIGKVRRFSPKDHGATERRATINFGACQQIDPGAVLIFMHAVRQLHANGCNVSFQGTKMGDAFRAMAAHYLHYILPKGDRQSVPTEEGDYPLRAISSQEDMVSELEEWAECVQKTTGASRARMAGWNTHVSELTTNRFQHGCKTGDFSKGLRRVLIVGAAGRQKVQLAVLDAGSGIPSVLGPHLKQPARHDGSIIGQACQERVTSRCDPSNQGHGLPGLVQAVKVAQGTLQIFSGSGLCHVKNGRVYERNLAPPWGRHLAFAGTLTIITLQGATWKS